MVVDDFQNFRLIQPVHGLGALVVIHQNDLLAVYVQQVAAADHTAVLAVFVQNGEVAVAHARHDLLRVLHGRVYAEFQQAVGAHKVAHGRGSRHQTAGGVGVVGRGQNVAALFLGARHNGARYSRAAADDQRRRAAVNGAHLGFVPVGYQHQIAGLDQLLHNFGAGADADVAFRDAGVLIAQQQLGVQRFQQIGQRGVCLRQHVGVQQLHIGVGNVLDGDKPL